MNNKFLLLIFLFIASTLNAGFSLGQIQQAKAMVKANPSLLNTPQAKKMMQQNGVTPGQASSKLEKKSLNIENDIDSKEKTDTPQEEDDYILDKSDVENFEALRLTPQEYTSNGRELYRVKSNRFKRKSKKLIRFSQEFFKNKNKIAKKSINASKNYIINRGDTISFWVYGATNTEHELVVNSLGNINIPQVGPVRVAGEKYAEVKELLTNYLSSSYKNSDVVVDLNSFSTAQVTLTGFVKAPGIFNTSSVSSVKDILIEAHGVADVGSVRNIQVKRNGRVIAKIDYYHLLSLGRDDGDIVLQPNDTIHVPRAYGLVRLEGAVNHEAIFEIERGESLSKILRIAGGVLSQADGLKIQIKRYDNNRAIKYQKITLAQARSFRLKDGDEIIVGEMGNVNERYINVIGNVIYEGKRDLGSQTMQLSQLLKKEIRGGKLNTFFLENTKLDYAVIKRVADDMSPQILNVNLKNILDGAEDFTLKNRDTLYIFNQLDTKTNPYVTILQAQTKDEIEKAVPQTLLMQDGQHLFTQGMTVQDLINAAGVTGTFDFERVKVVSYDQKNKKANIKIVNYQDNPNYKLNAYDTVYIFDFFETNPMPTAYITGEIIKPGKYEVSQAMTLEKFIKSAGGFSEKAYPKECEVIRYQVKNGEREKKIFNIELSKIDSFIIQAHDEISIKRIPNWYERKIIKISGEVKFPGSYIIHSGERLSSVIKRAGGFTDQAFLYGAVFSRLEIAVLQQKSLSIELAKLKEQVILASLRSSGSKSMGAIDISESIKAVESLILEAERLTPTGRISIKLGDSDNKPCGECGEYHDGQFNDNLKDSASDLVLKDKDSLHIPSFNDTVVVSGEVMNPMASIYLGNNIRDYISKSGGLTEIADTDHIYVMHANGEAQKATIGSYLFASNKVSVQKGDMIIVPKKLMFQRGIDIVSEVADIFYKLTLTVAAMHTVGAL